MVDGGEAYPRLIGDIGGTHARFAVVRAPGAALERQRTQECARFESLAAAIECYLCEAAVPAPHSAVLGVAMPVTGDAVRMVNRSWSFSIAALRRALGLQRLTVINDFEAMAAAIPVLASGEVQGIGGGIAEPGAPVAVLGPGTGLGVALLAPVPGGYLPMAGEGGHITLAAFDDDEADVIARLRRRHGHVSAERVLSGPGLEQLYAVLGERRGSNAPSLRASEISARGLVEACPVCAEALRLFCAMLGTVASNLALTAGARGGVYLGGGIVPRLGDYFAASDFRRRFEDKGRFSAYLAAIPTLVIRAENPGLIGAARYP